MCVSCSVKPLPLVTANAGESKQPDNGRIVCTDKLQLIPFVPFWLSIATTSKLNLRIK